MISKKMFDDTALYSTTMYSQAFPLMIVEL